MRLENLNKMRSLKLLILICFFSISIIFSLINVEAACTDEQTILKISSATNAHGERFDGAGSYATEICYNEIFGENYAYGGSSNLRTCGESNKVVGLSSTTNAHAEIPTSTIYSTYICYGDLQCTVRAGSCIGEEKLIVSLSATTNAHLANDLSYSNLICCSSENGEPPENTCAFTSSYWSASSSGVGTLAKTNKGNTVYLIAKGNPSCNGELVDFLIGEVDLGNNYAGRDATDTNKLVNDFLTATFSGGVAIVSWTAEWYEDTGNILGNDNPEYVFRAALRNDVSILIDNSGKLEVDDEEIIDPNIKWCQDYLTLGTCQAFSPIVAKNTVQSINPNVNCDALNTVCFCYWDIALANKKCQGGYNITNIIEEPDVPIGKCLYIRNTNDDCADGMLDITWTANWEWNPACVGTCRTQNSALAAACVGGSKTVECPAELALPFFNYYNLLVAILVIAIIYIATSLKKRYNK